MIVTKIGDKMNRKKIKVYCGVRVQVDDHIILVTTLKCSHVIEIFKPFEPRFKKNISGNEIAIANTIAAKFKGKYRFEFIDDSCKFKRIFNGVVFRKTCNGELRAIIEDDSLVRSNYIGYADGKQLRIRDHSENVDVRLTGRYDNSCGCVITGSCANLNFFVYEKGLIVKPPTK